ncbi:GATA transcription factor 2-like [Actinidia eriantha]|uniref:GATA transcription factor 2-like n=1 Tax=Actinidia eriantha TaxID=165200 RepID=UPI00258B2035|nr:GATA transcription factor 2-like [Actinidia eriantha]
MDAYGTSATECFRVDDLLDFSNDEIFSGAATADSDLHRLPPYGRTYAPGGAHYSAQNLTESTNFTDDLCVPSDDVAELEWLSNFVDDSFTDFSPSEFVGSGNHQPETPCHGRSRSKRSKATSINREQKENAASANSGKKRESTSSSSGLTGDISSPTPSENSPAAIRRCTHCASEKTPQWRTGPLGPKTLCNACGVRFKSGRLVPEYRPAASPTFVLTEHSNSHRKVMELRRQKEVVRRDQQQEQPQLFRRPHNFEVC